MRQQIKKHRKPLSKVSSPNFPDIPKFTNQSTDCKYRVFSLFSSASEVTLRPEKDEIPLTLLGLSLQTANSYSYPFVLKYKLFFLLTCIQKEHEAYPLLKQPHLIGCKLLSHNNTIKSNNGTVSLTYLRK